MTRFASLIKLGSRFRKDANGNIAVIFALSAGAAHATPPDRELAEELVNKITWPLAGRVTDPGR